MSSIEKEMQTTKKSERPADGNPASRAKLLASRIEEGAAGLLAFAAWLSGDGALAWCAVERCLAADPDHTLAHLVARALEQAVPPSEWSPPSRPRRYAGREAERRSAVVD